VLCLILLIVEKVSCDCAF